MQPYFMTKYYKNHAGMLVEFRSKNHALLTIVNRFI
jgi:hypothetical protein